MSVFAGADGAPEGVHPTPAAGDVEQLDAAERLRDRLREVDINRTTPLDALQLLQELKKESED